MIFWIIIIVIGYYNNNINYVDFMFILINAITASSILHIYKYTPKERSDNKYE